MENINIEVLPRNYWINGDKPVIVYKSKSLKQETANIVALIISCVTETFSELLNCKKSTFIRFQEQVQNIILSEFSK